MQNARVHQRWEAACKHRDGGGPTWGGGTSEMDLRGGLISGLITMGYSGLTV